MNMRRNTNTDIGKIEVEETGLIDVVKCLMNLRKEVVPFILFVNRCCMGACTGISFVDSTALRVCRNQRIRLHKVFKGLAQRGQCSMGWFYGFKLHLICSEKGELLNFMLTPGNVDDRDPLRNKSFIERIFGKLVGDKGYICRDLFSRLFVDGIQLITKLKSNMKGQLMTVSDKILLRKRALIETINGELKNIAQIEHSRHRSVVGFTVNLMADPDMISYLKGEIPFLALREHVKLEEQKWIRKAKRYSLYEDQPYRIK